MGKDVRAALEHVGQGIGGLSETDAKAWVRGLAGRDQYQAELY